MTSTISLRLVERKMNISWLLALFLPAAAAKACQGENLAKDAPLRIGVKHKPESCDKRSQPGDTLKMHYTGCSFHDVLRCCLCDVDSTILLCLYPDVPCAAALALDLWWIGAGVASRQA